MTTTRYLIAKYIPDMFRGEPRNIGVVVWSLSGVVARFMAVKNADGQTDARKIPDWIKSAQIYSQWTEFWFAQLAKDEIEFVGQKKTAKRNSPDFLEALKTTSNENYILQDRGAILEEVSESNLDDAADFLYRILVDTNKIKERDASVILHDTCETIIRKTKLQTNTYFKRQEKVFCRIDTNVQETYEFDYYYGNGKPQWLGFRIPFPKYKKELDNSIDASAWRCERIAGAGILPKDKIAAFIFPTDDQLKESRVRSAIEVLKTVARVLDVRDEAPIVKELESLPPIQDAHAA